MSDALNPFTDDAVPAFWDEKTFLHEVMGDYLVESYDACQMGGAPAVWDTVAGRYKVSYDSWDEAIINTTPGTKVCHRKEVTEYLKIKAPKLDPRAYPQYIAVENGLVNPFEEGFGTLGEDGQTIGYYLNSPEIPICNILPVTWDPTAYDQATDDWLASYCQGDEGMRANLEELFALCIYRGQEIQQSVWLIGDGGNGKSSLINVLLRFLGEGNYSTVDMDDLSHKFGLPEMVGKLANIGDDQMVTKIDARACKIFKKMVVGSEIEVEQKNRPRFRVKPYCSFVYSTNAFPILADTSDGMLDRIHGINFTRRFRYTDGQIARIEDVLDNPTSRSYLLNLALRRLPAMVRRGGFTPTVYSTQKRHEINLESNSVLAFATEYLDYSHVVDQIRDDIYVKYLDFCERNGYKSPVSIQKFSTRINKIFNLTTAKDGPVLGGVQQRMFRAK